MNNEMGVTNEGKFIGFEGSNKKGLGSNSRDDVQLTRHMKILGKIKVINLERILRKNLLKAINCIAQNVVIMGTVLETARKIKY